MTAPRTPDAGDASGPPQSARLHGALGRAWAVWVRAGLIVGLALLVVDAAGLPWARGPGQSLAALLWLGGVLLPGTLCLSAGAGVLLLLAERWLPRILRPLLPLALAAPLAIRLGIRLNVVERWAGRYHHLAVAVAAALALGSLLFVLLLLQFLDTGRGAPLRRWQPSRRYALGAALVVLASAQLWLDAHHLLGLYAAAHQALRLSAVMCGLLAVVAFSRAELLRPRRLGLAAAALLAAGGAVAFAFAPITPAGTLAAERPLFATFVGAGRWAVDFDGDRYSPLWGGGDCDDGNPRVHPGACEISDNRIDDNCYGGDYTTAVLPTPSWAETPRERRAGSVLLVTVDALRADHVGSPGHAAHARTPALDAFAGRGVVFDRAYASGGYTPLSLNSLFRSIPPRMIRWSPFFLLEGFLAKTPTEIDEMRQAGSRPRIVWTMTRPDPDRHPTLATVLGMHGFRTLAIPNDDWAKFPIMLGSTHGFQELVDVDNLPGAREDASNDHVALEEAIGRLRGLGGQRFFLWLHFFAPHYPLRLHPQVPAPSVDAIESRYAHAVEFVDWLMGRLLDAVAATGRSDIAVVFTGDHGEVLRPEQTHGIDTTEDLIRVPLLVGGPGVVPRHVSEVVSLVDLAPTLLAWAGARPPAEMQGVDLRPVLWGGDGPRDRAVVVDTWLHDGAGNPNWDFIAVVTERRKLRWDRRARTLKLTDPVTDPADTHNLRGTEDSSRLLRVLRDYEERSGCLDSLR